MFRIVDDLDAVFAVAGDDVVAERELERLAAIRLEANLDAIVVVVEIAIVDDEWRRSLVVVDAIIGVFLE